MHDYDKESQTMKLWSAMFPVMLQLQVQQTNRIIQSSTGFSELLAFSTDKTKTVTTRMPYRQCSTKLMTCAEISEEISEFCNSVAWLILVIVPIPNLMLSISFMLKLKYAHKNGEPWQWQTNFQNKKSYVHTYTHKHTHTRYPLEFY